jgi:uncharacterized YigZ family protein
LTEPLNYNTIGREAFAEFKDRSSKFLAYAYPIKHADDFKKAIHALKKEHPKAEHHCFAYRLGTDGNSFRASDDGEPAGAAGRPILGQIDGRQLTNTAIVVVRYFGGTLLGVPGLINAYKSSAAMALQLTPVIQKPVMAHYNLSFDYTRMNEVMQIAKRLQCIILKSDIQLFCSVQVAVPKANEDQFLYKLKDLEAIELTRLNNK